MNKRILGAAAAVALLAGSLTAVTPAPLAHAGNCTGGVVCGHVRNSPVSKAAIFVYDGWSADPKKPAGNMNYVYPGKEGVWKDDDGFCLQPGHTGRYALGSSKSYKSLSAGQCVKVSDGSSANVVSN